MVGWRLLAVAASAAACAGCLFRDTPTRPSGPPVDYVRRRFESSLAGCHDERGAPASCVRLQVEYVEATRATVELAHAVSRFVAASVLRPVGDAPWPTSVEELRDDLYAAYREVQGQVSGYKTRWEIQRRVTVACNAARVQGLVASERSFTGGTRPVDRVRYQSFDTRSGVPIGLDAMIDPGQLEEFLAELQERRRSAGGAVATPGLWSRDAAPRDDRVTAPDSVLVCPDALTARWDDGGGVEVVVPRDAIRALLRTDAP